MAEKVNIFNTKKGKKVVNMINGLGASVVILGAMFKILHLPGGSFVIGLGLMVEVVIFGISAFDPIEEKLDWTKAYPELKEGAPSVELAGRGMGGGYAGGDPVSEGLSSKLDEILREAQLDVNVIKGLKESIDKLQVSTSAIGAGADISKLTSEYGDQLAYAVDNIKDINNIYADQIEESLVNKEIQNNLTLTFQNTEKLQTEMSTLVGNITELNKVYEGMLTAMKK
ncbi:type IX secretion system motor protein PorL/GldL [Ichthyobacterium seriolicida]|uniref:Gliding motility protein GldL n=1 Tax=Ichthyobacterium seriolicida TaxID=242600 RepID=A0A1J1EBX8_9FLAO|nr:gliding motility protein GldL [Ichthyobacterium seriolicida]BAV95443.1 gliding motility protein GldL [Ichthyobacterium seriolicida]